MLDLIHLPLLWHFKSVIFVPKGVGCQPFFFGTSPVDIVLLSTTIGSSGCNFHSYEQGQVVSTLSVSDLEGACAPSPP